MLLAVIDISSLRRYIYTYRHTPLWLVFATMLLLSWLCPLASVFFLVNVARLSWGVRSPKSISRNGHNLSWLQVCSMLGRKAILCVQRNISKMRCIAVEASQDFINALQGQWVTSQHKETSKFCSDHSVGSVSAHHSVFIALSIYIFKPPWQVQRLEAKLSATSQQL